MFFGEHQMHSRCNGDRCMAWNLYAWFVNFVATNVGITCDEVIYIVDVDNRFCSERKGRQPFDIIIIQWQLSQVVRINEIQAHDSANTLIRWQFGFQGGCTFPCIFHIWHDTSYDKCEMNMEMYIHWHLNWWNFIPVLHQSILSICKHVQWRQTKYNTEIDY